MIFISVRNREESLSKQNSDYDYEDVVGALTKVFGIVGICPIVVEEDTSFEAIKEKVIEYVDKAYRKKNILPLK